MDESIRTAAISPLRQRLIDDMNMRRFSRETQRNYIRDVGRFATFLGRSPDTATADDVRYFRSNSAMPGGGRHEVSAWMEVAMNECVGGEEILGLLGRSKPLHLSLPTSRRSV